MFSFLSWFIVLSVSLQLSCFAHYYCASFNLTTTGKHFEAPTWKYSVLLVAQILNLSPRDPKYRQKHHTSYACDGR